MATVRWMLGVVVASALLAGCGSDDDASTERLAADPTARSTIATTAPSTTTIAPTTSAPAPPESARYRVTLVVEWGPTSHPATLPPGWHTSRGVVAAHRTPGDLIPIGTTASAGVESMAETGKTSLMQDELAANPAVGAVDTGQGIEGTGSDELEVDTTQSTNLLSVVTMLAPSPDWFVGAVDVQVFENGAWRDRVEVDLNPWDAGTDSGPRFTSANADTQPRQPIAAPRDPDYIEAASEGRFGFVVIERIG